MAATAIALALGLFLSMLVALRAQDEIARESRAEFHRIADRLAIETERRINQPVYGLQGGRGVYAASKSVERGEFTAYVRSRNFQTEFPGAIGFGFIERVLRDDLPAFIAYERSDEAPDFEVRTSGNAPDLFITKFIEPMDVNRASWGQDIGADPICRAAAEHAMRSGKPTITVKLTLPQDPTGRTAFLYLVPVYRNGTDPQTEQERVAALQGWVFAPIILEEVFADMIQTTDGQLGFDLFDDDAPTDAGKFFDPLLSRGQASAVAGDADHVPRFETMERLSVGGRHWWIWVASTPQFEAAMDRQAPMHVAVGGALISIMLAAVIWSLGSSRARAKEMARTMTQDLKEAQERALVEERQAQRQFNIERARLAAFVEHAPAAVAMFDRNMTTLAVSNRWQRDYQLQGQTIIGRSHYDVFPDCPQLWRDIHTRCLAGAVEQCDDDTWRLPGSDHDQSLRWEVRPWYDEAGQIAGIMIFTQDITEDKELRRTLEEKNASLNHALGELDVASAEMEDTLRQLQAYKHALDQHAIVTVTDAQGVITDANDQFCQISHFTREQVVGQQHRIVDSGHHPRTFWEGLWRTVIGGATWSGEICNRARDGSLYWVATTIVPFSDAHGTITRFIAMGYDITDRKRYELELKVAARLDKLTGLPNRALLHDRLQQAIARSGRVPGYQFALMFLDFDRFKIINDSLGHEVGDLMLKEIAARLKASLRTNDSISRDIDGSTVARIGGDEFVIILDSISGPEGAAVVAQRLLDVFHDPYQLAGHEVRSTASIGVVMSDAKYSKADDMVRDADTAMYEAKARGKACFVMFDKTMQEAVQNQLQTEIDMRIALATGQFRLAYQPIVTLEDGQLCGVESLVRWQHPTRGLIPPDQFIHIAEETRMILPLSQWILEESCRQFMQWKKQAPDRAPQYISVNLSRIQLTEPDLVERVLAVITAAGMRPDELQLEVTETEIMQNRVVATRALKQLKAHSIRLAMDDFGTGYSSLSCLYEFPFDVLKIDRTFIANLGRGREFVALAHSVVTLAGHMGMTCVAEGIETDDQIAILQSMDCICGQGYRFGRPMDADDLIAGLWRRQTVKHVA